MRWKKILSGILVSAMALGAVVSGIPQKALGAENLAGSEGQQVFPKHSLKKEGADL